MGELLAAVSFATQLILLNKCSSCRFQQQQRAQAERAAAADRKAVVPAAPSAPKVDASKFARSQTEAWSKPSKRQTWFGKLGNKITQLFTPSPSKQSGAASPQPSPRLTRQTLSLASGEAVQRAAVAVKASSSLPSDSKKAALPARAAAYASPGPARNDAMEPKPSSSAPSVSRYLPLARRRLSMARDDLDNSSLPNSVSSEVASSASSLRALSEQPVDDEDVFNMSM